MSIGLAMRVRPPKEEGKCWQNLSSFDSAADASAKIRVIMALGQRELSPRWIWGQCCQSDQNGQRTAGLPKELQ